MPRIEALQSLKCRRSLDPTVVVRYDQYRVTIEVCARETLCHLRVNTHCILGIAEKLLGARVVVVHSEFRDLEDAAMWVANECDSLTIPVVRCVDLCRLHAVDREDDMRSLSWQCCSLQMYSRRVCLISERLQQLTTNCRVGKPHDLVELILPLTEGEIQLLLGQSRGLLRQHLRRQTARPGFPIALFIDHVHGRDDFPIL